MIADEMQDAKIGQQRQHRLGFCGGESLPLSDGCGVEERGGQTAFWDCGGGVDCAGDIDARQGARAWRNRATARKHDRVTEWVTEVSDCSPMVGEIHFEGG